MMDTEQIALKMDPATRRRVLGGEVVSRFEAMPGTSMPRVIFYARIDQPIERVWRLVETTELQPEVLPRVKSAVVVVKKDDYKHVRIVIDMPFPLKNLSSVTKIKQWVGEDGTHYQTWSLVEGDYHFNNGDWACAPVDGEPGSTVLRYRLHADPHVLIPKKIQVWGQRFVIPKMAASLRRHAAR